nr:hypothetical protein [Enterococcus faecium]
MNKQERLLHKQRLIPQKVVQIKVQPMIQQLARQIRRLQQNRLKSLQKTVRQIQQVQRNPVVSLNQMKLNLAKQSRVNRNQKSRTLAVLRMNHRLSQQLNLQTISKHRLLLQTIKQRQQEKNSKLNQQKASQNRITKRQLRLFKN